MCVGEESHLKWGGSLVVDSNRQNFNEFDYLVQPPKKNYIILSKKLHKNVYKIYIWRIKYLIQKIYAKK